MSDLNTLKMEFILEKHKLESLLVKYMNFNTFSNEQREEITTSLQKLEVINNNFRVQSNKSFLLGRK